MSDTLTLLPVVGVMQSVVGTLDFGEAATATILAAVVGACLLLLCVAGQLVRLTVDGPLISERIIASYIR